MHFANTQHLYVHRRASCSRGSEGESGGTCSSANFGVFTFADAGTRKPFVGDFDGNGVDDIFWYVGGPLPPDPDTEDVVDRCTDRCEDAYELDAPEHGATVHRGI